MASVASPLILQAIQKAMKPTIPIKPRVTPVIIQQKMSKRIHASLTITPFSKVILYAITIASFGISKHNCSAKARTVSLENSFAKNSRCSIASSSYRALKNRHFLHSSGFFYTYRPKTGEKGEPVAQPRHEPKGWRVFCGCRFMLRTGKKHDSPPSTFTRADGAQPLTTKGRY